MKIYGMGEITAAAFSLNGVFDHHRYVEFVRQGFFSLSRVRGTTLNYLLRPDTAWRSRESFHIFVSGRRLRPPCLMKNTFP